MITTTDKKHFEQHPQQQEYERLPFKGEFSGLPEGYRVRVHKINHGCIVRVLLSVEGQRLGAIIDGPNASQMTVSVPA